MNVENYTVDFKKRKMLRNNSAYLALLFRLVHPSMDEI
jgi:hypothetical protein